MYTNFFGFHTKPFSVTPDPAFFFPSESHRDGLANLRYGIKESMGFIVLTGEVGTGKTLLIRSLLEELGEEVKRALILNPILDPDEMFTAILRDLEVPYNENEGFGTRLESFNHYLLQEYEAGRRVVVIIDESQNLSIEALERLRLLSNLETNTAKLLQIVLVGQPELNTLLSKPELRQLDQRVTVRCHLKPFSESETPKYIEHRIEVASEFSTKAVFERGAVKLIHKASKGIPRLIGVLCDYALLVAFTEDKRTITSGMAKEAIEKHRRQQRLHHEDRSPDILAKVGWALGGMAVCAALFGFGLWWTLQNDPGSGRDGDLFAESRRNVDEWYDREFAPELESSVEDWGGGELEIEIDPSEAAAGEGGAPEPPREEQVPIVAAPLPPRSSEVAVAVPTNTTPPPIPTNSPTQTLPPTPPPTATPVPPTFTPTLTQTSTPTSTPTSTETATPSPTFTEIPPPPTTAPLVAAAPAEEPAPMELPAPPVADAKDEPASPARLPDRPLTNELRAIEPVAREPAPKSVALPTATPTPWNAPPLDEPPLPLEEVLAQKRAEGVGGEAAQRYEVYRVAKELSGQDPSTLPDITPKYGVQVASLKTLDRSARMGRDLRHLGPVFLVPWTSPDGQEWIRVVLGIYRDRPTAFQMIQYLQHAYRITDALIVENRWWRISTDQGGIEALKVD